MAHTLGLYDPASATPTFRVLASRLPPAHGVTGIEIRALPAAAATAPDELVRWLRAELADAPQAAVWLDAFPAGVVGELTRLSELGERVCYHVARRVRWEAYRAFVLEGLPYVFRRVYVLEELEDAQHRALCACCERLDFLELRDPPAPLSAPALAALAELPRPIWCVTHAGSVTESQELMEYARDCARLECTPQNIRPALVLLGTDFPEVAAGAEFSVIRHLTYWPAHELFGRVDRVYSGCGSNTMRQMAHLRERHRFLPFPRRYDDQFRRAAQVGRPG